MTTHPTQIHRRHIKYVDQQLQLWLLVALVLFELFLTALGTGFLYLQFNQILEVQLYSVHLSPDGGFQGLMERVLYVVAGLTIVNIAALLAADRYWLSYVAGLMGKLDESIGKLIRLELTPADIPASEHRLLDLLSRWFVQERQLHLDMRGRITALSERLEHYTEQDRSEILEQIDDLLKALNR
jgi:hypothetical protein